MQFISGWQKSSRCYGCYYSGCFSVNYSALLPEIGCFGKVYDDLSSNPIHKTLEINEIVLIHFENTSEFYTVKYVKVLGKESSNVAITC